MPPTGQSPVAIYPIQSILRAGDTIGFVMARRGSVAGIIMALARESARQQRIAVANAQRAERESIREQKRLVREALLAGRRYSQTLKQSERETKALYIEQRQQEVE